MGGGIRRAPVALMKWALLLALALVMASGAAGCKEAEDIKKAAQGKKKDGPPDEHVDFVKREMTESDLTRKKVNQMRNYLMAAMPPPADLEAAKAALLEAKIQWRPDSWGNEILYKLQDGKPTPYSVGPDGKDGTADDVYPAKDKVNRKEVN